MPAPASAIGRPPRPKAVEVQDPVADPAEPAADDPAAVEPGRRDPAAVESWTVATEIDAGEVPVATSRAQARPAPGPPPVVTPRFAVQPPARNGAGDAERNACTAPQLRRFIKSRAYVPMHELRRRFGIEGQDDDVTGVDMGSGTHVYVGLPQREGLLLGELLRARDVGYELSLDPIAPIVVGVFPMRPIPRS